MEYVAVGLMRQGGERLALQALLLQLSFPLRVLNEPARRTKDK